MPSWVHPELSGNILEPLGVSLGLFGACQIQRFTAFKFKRQKTAIFECHPGSMLDYVGAFWNLLGSSWDALGDFGHAKLDVLQRLNLNAEKLQLLNPIASDR